MLCTVKPQDFLEALTSVIQELCFGEEALTLTLTWYREDAEYVLLAVEILDQRGRSFPLFSYDDEGGYLNRLRITSEAEGEAQSEEIDVLSRLAAKLEAQGEIFMIVTDDLAGAEPRKGAPMCMVGRPAAAVEVFFRDREQVADVIDG